jgi:glyoxylase-like metal-dependent hydrolase (beta-lactamase superfamily II)
VGTTEAIDKGIWMTRVTLDDYDVRGALILGKQRAAVWDTLSRPRDMRPFVPLIGSREIVIVYSHADWDHVWGTAGLDYDGVQIVAHEQCGWRFGADVPVVLAEKRTAAPGTWDDIVLVPPTECFERERSLDLGGLTVALHHLPGHTPDCIVGFIPERGILFAGDTVETPCPVVPADSDLSGWISALRSWADDTRVRRVIPAHGAIGGREIVQQTVEYLDGIRIGRPIEPSGSLSRFYRETHLSNIRWRAG